MACNFQKFSISCVGKVRPPHEPVNLNTSLNCIAKSFTKKLSTVALEKTPTNGKFGSFGGKFVGEIMIAPLAELEAKFNLIWHNHEFQMELEIALRDYAGRETPLYHAKKLTDHYKNINGEGPEIYLKREDLNHGGSYKMINAIAQAILAKRIGKESVITATSVGHHGVATAAACARFSLDCTIFIGTKDIQQKPTNVQLMKLLGAQVKPVEGNFQAAVSDSTREWIERLETDYYLAGTAVGPHPIPTMVREFNSVIGRETRKQAMEKWGGKPDVLVACIGTGCNALGLFHEFIGDESVRMIGVEGGGGGGVSHCASLVRGDIGVYHGALCYLLQDEEGQITTTQSVASGLEYPGVSPELSFLKDAGRVDCYTVTDQEALLVEGNAVSQSSFNKTKGVLTVVLSISSAVLLLFAVAYASRKKKQRSQIKGRGKWYALDKKNTSVQMDDLEELPFYGLHKVTQTANNFSINNKIGEGGFGPVYKIVMSFLISSFSAAVGVGQLGKTGNSHAGWLPICGQVPKFCHHVSAALIAGFVAVIIYFLLLLYSLNNVLNLVAFKA